MSALKDVLIQKMNIPLEPQLPTPVVEEGNIIPFSNKKEPVQPIQVVPELLLTLDEARQRVIMLQQFVKEMMIEGVDYGLIPNCPKPTLLKSGAEKLCDIFGFSKRIDIINRLEDWDKGLFHYEVKATLISKKSGLVEAEGVGSCNSKEKKYIKQDGFSIANTILKMAKKRALVDSVLSATRSSGLFSQDLEDMVLPLQASDNVQKVIPANDTKVHYPATKTQLQEIFLLTAQNGITVPEMKKFLKDTYEVNNSKELSHSSADDLIIYLKSMLEYKK